MLSSAGTSVKFWDTQSFKLTQEINGTSSNEVSSLSWNKDGQFLSSLDKQSSEIALYTVNGSSSVCSLVMRLMDNITCLKFCNTTNRYLAVGGARDSLLIWDVKGNFKKKSFTVARAGITKVSFSPPDSHLAVGTIQGDAFIISNTNNLISGPVKLFSCKSRVKDIQYSSLNRSLVGACGENGSVALLDVNATKVVKEFSQPHTAPVSNLAFSPINELLMITVGYDKKFISYNANTKKVVIDFQTPYPLTSACFMNNGQCVALGSMTGEIVIYDLRILTTPLGTISAHNGPVHDLKMQPQPKTQNLKGPKSATKNSSTIERLNVQNTAEKGKRIANKLGTTNQPPGSKPLKEELSPSKLELLSPLKPQVNQEVPYPPKTPLLKNFKTPAKPSRRDTLKSDELGILSPIDKENQSPRYSLETPKVSTLPKQTFVDGLLSPLQTSPLSILSSTQSTLDSSKTKNELDFSLEQIPREDIVEDYSELLLSPLNKESQNGEDETAKNVDTGSELLNVNPTSCVNVNDGTSEVVSNLSLLETESKVGSHAITESESEFSEDILARKMSESFDTYLRETNVADTNLCNKISRGNSVMDDSSKMKKNSESEERTESATKSVTFVDDKISCESNIFELAFPPCAVMNEPSVSQESKSPSPKNVEDLSSSKMNLELIQSCVADALERHEFNINKRFMHMHYSMLKQFYHLKKEMTKLIKENSINEEVLLENQKLKEEIKRLKCIY